MRILARLLTVHGEAYVKKFKEKSGGFTIVVHRLKRWWHLPALWPCCFAILFNVDVAKLNLDRTFDLFGFIELFSPEKEMSIVYPEMFEVIAAMLQTGLKTIISSKQLEKSSSLAPRPMDHRVPRALTGYRCLLWLRPIRFSLSSPPNTSTLSRPSSASLLTCTRDQRSSVTSQLHLHSFKTCSRSCSRGGWL